MSDEPSPAPLAGLPEGARSDRLAWLGVAAVAISLVAGAVAVVGGLDDGEQPPFMTEAAQLPPARAERADGPLRLAGSGSNLPLTRALTERYGSGARVFASIGSGGGVRALLDGAIDIALISRHLKPNERAMGLVEHPYARVPVLVAVHRSVPDREITGDELLAVYRGDKRTWSDGTRIVVLQREQGDSSHAAVEAVLEGFKEVNEHAYREAMWRVIYNDAAMSAALRSTDRAIGLHVGAGEREPEAIRALTFEGKSPSPEAVAAGDYPFTKDLSFVTVGEPSAEVQEFIEFHRSDEARAFIRSLGAQPLPEGQG